MTDLREAFRHGLLGIHGIIKNDEIAATSGKGAAD
jgi:hypothetical protein